MNYRLRLLWYSDPFFFGMGESPLFEIDRELRNLYPELDIEPFIGDIKHADVIDRAFSMFKPDFVYHAAAYKHVPLMENHPDEAVLNNVRGMPIRLTQACLKTEGRASAKVPQGKLFRRLSASKNVAPVLTG